MPLNVLVCRRLPVHAQHGFAGKGIEHFPPYGFFKLYQQQHEHGEEAFKDWYRHRFLERGEWGIDKSEGGMRDGSLHRLVREVHETHGQPPRAEPQPYDPKLVEEAITRRVRHYLDVFESIRERGYAYSNGYIECVESAHGDLEIVTGHHRVAAALALGIPELDVQVVPGSRSRPPPEEEPTDASPLEPAGGSAAGWDEEQIKEWIASSDWYQRIPVREGLITPGRTDSVGRLERLRLPSLEGKTVLDIGCNSGMYSFECERRGASRVVGIDLNEKRLSQARTLTEILGSRVEFRHMKLEEATSLGQFDYVFCIAMLHETTDLLGGLEVLKDAARIAIYLEISLWKPPLSRRRPLAKLARNKRGSTLLPTRALLEDVMRDTFEVEPLGPSVRYDLFRIVRRSSIGG